MTKPHAPEARNRLIVGHPPRIPPVPQEDIAPEVREEMDRLGIGFGAGPLDAGNPGLQAL